jgi:hypothetical protein
LLSADFAKNAKEDASFVTLMSAQQLWSESAMNATMEQAIIDALFAMDLESQMHTIAENAFSKKKIEMAALKSSI